MKQPPQGRVLAFAGSARRDSLNRKLAAAASVLLEEDGVDCTLVELRDYPLPLYDGDLEDSDGLPGNAATLRELFLGHDALLIVAPEYNSSITPLLKNTLDWVSRSPDGGGDLSPYRGKIASLLSASPGRLGGLRGLVTVRSILSNIGVVVLPKQFALAGATDAFAPDGALREEHRDKVAAVTRELSAWLART